MNLMWSPHVRTEADVVALATPLLEQHAPGWVFAFDRATKRAGSCNYTTKTITVSKEYALKVPDANLRNTLLHELAHAITGPRTGHGPVWKSTAVRIGCTGDRCHAVAFSPTKYSVACPCKVTYMNRVHKYTQPGVVCSVCKQPLVVTCLRPSQEKKTLVVPLNCTDVPQSVRLRIPTSLAKHFATPTTLAGRFSTLHHTHIREVFKANFPHIRVSPTLPINIYLQTIISGARGDVWDISPSRVEYKLPSGRLRLYVSVEIYVNSDGDNFPLHVHLQSLSLPMLRDLAHLNEATHLLPSMRTKASAVQALASYLLPLCVPY